MFIEIISLFRHYGYISNLCTLYTENKQGAKNKNKYKKVENAYLFQQAYYISNNSYFSRLLTFKMNLVTGTCIQIKTLEKILLMYKSID